MSKETCADLQFIVDACYVSWQRRSRKHQENSRRKYGAMLHGRYTDRWFAFVITLFAILGGYSFCFDPQ